MKLKKILGLLILLTGSNLAVMAYAADATAKEETTPPPAEGALTANQIPPISTLGKPIAPAPKANPATNATPTPAGQTGQLPPAQ